jgi:uncharacterized protein (DUF2252 family)
VHRSRPDGDQLYSDTVGPKVPLGRRFWPLAAEEFEALRELFATKDIVPLLSALKGGKANDDISLVDAAYWIKGCSSLGRLRYAVMLRIGSAKSSPLCLVDVKEATAAAAPRAANARLPADHAARVVAGAKALSPSLGERMIAASLLGKAS